MRWYSLVATSWFSRGCCFQNPSSIIAISSQTFLTPTTNYLVSKHFHISSIILKKKQLLDSDIEESFVKGSGPGGQKINKVRNCVQLKHLPTGIMVSCQDGRGLTSNRAIARKLLEKKVEFAQLGSESRLGKAITKKKKQKDRNHRRAKLKHEKLQSEKEEMKAEVNLNINNITLDKLS